MIGREVKERAWQPVLDSPNLRPSYRHKLKTRPARERIYLAVQAHHHAAERRARSHRAYRLMNDDLLDWVVTHLKKGWSPEEISGRLPLVFPDNPRMRVCHEALYQWIYSKEQAWRELAQYLPRGQKKRRRRGGRRVHSARIKDRTSIHDRPGEVEDRSVFGHWESDSVLGARGTGAIHTSVERFSRYFQAIKIPSASAGPTVEAQEFLIERLPEGSIKTITCDNGFEFVWHYKLKSRTGVQTYFADPYSAWQRGSNEHFNGRLRRYFPKGYSFAGLSQEELDEITTEINDHPRKCLGFHTPAEVFNQLTSNQAHACCTSK